VFNICGRQPPRWSPNHNLFLYKILHRYLLQWLRLVCLRTEYWKSDSVWFLRLLPMTLLLLSYTVEITSSEKSQQSCHEDIQAAERRCQQRKAQGLLPTISTDLPAMYMSDLWSTSSRPSQAFITRQHHALLSWDTLKLWPTKQR
jgi:hypothetical protein